MEKWNLHKRIALHILALIGTPTNGVLVTQLGQLFPQAPQITFASWMMFAFPLALAFTLLTWFLLSKILFPLPATTPIMGSLAQAIEVSPLLLMIPAAVAASCGFMLPVSTPPNAIVYSSGRVPIMKMVWAGLWLDTLAVILVTLFVYTVGHLSFDLLGAMPDWARR